MNRIIKAFLFKLKKDLTFRITLIVGLSAAVLMTLINFLIDFSSRDETGIKFAMCNGQNLLLSSLSPIQNFGLAIPINLIAFTVAEFTQGVIRNKIIAGNSKRKVYIGLFLSGLIFTFVIMIAYVLLCFALGSIIGGFDPNGSANTGNIIGDLIGTKITPEFLIRKLIVTVFIYFSITSFTIMIATLFRNVGPSITITLIVLLILNIAGMIILSNGYNAETNSLEGFSKIFAYINPLSTISFSSITSKTVGENTIRVYEISNSIFISNILNNLGFGALWLFAGMEIFNRSDIK